MTEICSFDGCYNKRLSSITDICASHRRQLLRDGELKPLARRNKLSPDGIKVCAECAEEKPASEYAEYASGRGYLFPACTSCATVYVKRIRLKTVYGLTLEEYNQMIESGCAVCAGTKDLAVDHDHNCCSGHRSCGKCVRGILCGDCNRAEGLMRGNTENLRRLIDYLEGKI